MDTPHQLRLEKLLVDLVADKFTSGLINNSETADIYEYCFKQYNIDVKKNSALCAKEKCRKKNKRTIK